MLPHTVGSKGCTYGTGQGRAWHTVSSPQTGDQFLVVVITVVLKISLNYAFQESLEDHTQFHPGSLGPS